LYGCYENICGPGSSTTRALQDLTGGIVQSFGLSNQDRFLTYQVLNSAVPRSSLLISTITLVNIVIYRTQTAVLAVSSLKYSLLYYFLEGKQETTKTAKRPDDSARLQCHRLGSGPRTTGRHSPGEAEEPLGRRRVDRALERKELGVGRVVPQGQRVAQCSGAQRR